MRRRRDSSWTIALTISLVVHGLGIDTAVFVHNRLTSNRLAFTAKSSSLNTSSDTFALLIPAPPRESRPFFLRDDFGEHGGTGDALNSSPGDKPLQGMPFDSEQAYLSKSPTAQWGFDPQTTPGRNATGNGGQGGLDKQPLGNTDTPSDASSAYSQTASAVPTYLLPNPANNVPPLGMPQSSVTPPLPPPHQRAKRPALISAIGSTDDGATPVTRPSSSDSTASIDSPTTKQVAIKSATRPVNATPVDHASKITPPTTPDHPPIPTTLSVNASILTAAVQPAASDMPAHRPTTHDLRSPNPGTPSAPSTGGGLGGLQSDTDTDPATKDHNFYFQYGKLVARDGRKVRFVRPRLTDAGMLDVMSMHTALVVLALKIDATGNVADVTILHSSGSNQIDEPTYLAAWKWWFEPPLDQAGQPIGDFQIIPVVFK